METKNSEQFPKGFPKQHQNRQPGKESEMKPEPIYELEGYNDLGKKLLDKVAIITGGDSGIGRAVAIAFAKEGAKIVLVHLKENDDANKTREIIEKKGAECILLNGDIGSEEFCKQIVKTTIDKYKTIDILINNSGEQHEQKNLEDITTEQIRKTFNTNFFGAFFLTREVMPHLKQGASIINTTSVVAYRGSKTLIDYSCTKGALTTFTRSLAINLADKGIRVNAVAPGPIWTPLIVYSFDETKVRQFGSDTPLKRAGQPVEIAQAYVFLASRDSSYITGETIHVNGGDMVNC